MFDHEPITDVSGMENMIDASEMSQDGRTEPAVNIGNDSRGP